jgi:thiamine biosynthesis lipoprotein
MNALYNSHFAIRLLMAVVAAFNLPTTFANDRYQRTQRHMGTDITIVLYAKSSSAAEAGFQAGFQAFARIDAVGSDYQPESELSQLSRSSPTKQPISVSEELWPILVESQRFASASEGAFDITVGPLTKLWRRARRQKELPTDAELHSALNAVGWKKLLLDHKQHSAQLTEPNMRLDLGGIAQGYAADRALQAMKALGITQALVDASGDVALGDPPPEEKGWRVGIAPLSGQGEPEKYLTLSHLAVVTSGDAYQAVTLSGRRYSHIVDPKTGLGLQQRSQVTVIAPNATTADALATALSVLGPTRGWKLLEQFPGTQARMVLQNEAGKVEEHVTSHFFQSSVQSK